LLAKLQGGGGGVIAVAGTLPQISVNVLKQQTISALAVLSGSAGNDCAD